jgi:hypothetical protein
MTTYGLRRAARAATVWTTIFGAAMLTCASSGTAAEPAAKPWTVGTPIVTYWAGPAMTDAVAKQMAEGGFNLVWCGEKDLDLVHRHGLRAQLTDGLLSPATLDNPAQREKLDALIARVAKHPAMYCYFITDEPGAGAFAALGKLVAYLRQRDPAHMAYINLFPTYASNDQLGTKGDVVTAYREHLRQFVEVVRPALVSYDHYQFAINGDNDGYFLNLAMIRRAADEAKLPFLNIVQACTWAPTAMRPPKPDEVRYLVYTTAAYGASGVSYYVYCCAGHVGGIALPDGTPTPLYHALKKINREFAAITSQTQPLAWQGAFHAGMTPPGAVGLPADAAFRLDPPVAPIVGKPRERVRGILLGLWGPPASAGAKAAASHVLVVNMDYQAAATTNLVGPGPLESLDALAGKWSPAGGLQNTSSQGAALQLPPGGGVLLRVKR